MVKTKFWTLVIAAMSAGVLGAACGDDGGGTGGGGDDGGDVCAQVSCDGTVPTFSDPSLPWGLCTGCHSDNATVRSTNGVPDDSDYTKYEGVSFRAELIVERIHATDSTRMPPSGSTQLTDADIEAFSTWGCCGAPE